MTLDLLISASEYKVTPDLSFCSERWGRQMHEKYFNWWCRCFILLVKWEKKVFETRKQSTVAMKCTWSSNWIVLPIHKTKLSILRLRQKNTLWDFSSFRWNWEKTNWKWMKYVNSISMCKQHTNTKASGTSIIHFSIGSVCYVVVLSMWVCLHVCTLHSRHWLTVVIRMWSYTDTHTHTHSPRHIKPCSVQPMPMLNVCTVIKWHTRLERWNACVNRHRKKHRRRAQTATKYN